MTGKNLNSLRRLTNQEALNWTNGSAQSQGGSGGGHWSRHHNNLDETQDLPALPPTLLVNGWAMKSDSVGDGLVTVACGPNANQWHSS